MNYDLCFDLKRVYWQGNSTSLYISWVGCDHYEVQQKVRFLSTGQRHFIEYM